MIECRGVSFSYDGAVSALDGVDLNIEDGEFFCILGGNGSGKSTFAKHLNALLQPDAGTVRINGMDASDPELVYDIRSTAGMVFQNYSRSIHRHLDNENLVAGGPAEYVAHDKGYDGCQGTHDADRRFQVAFRPDGETAVSGDNRRHLNCHIAEGQQKSKGSAGDKQVI